MTIQLRKLIVTEAQAIICWTIGPAGATVAKNFKSLGAKQILIQCHGLPDPEYLELAGEAAPVVLRAHERGLLVCVAGPNVLRLLPPLIVENEHIDFAIQCLDETLTEVEELQSEREAA